MGPLAISKRLEPGIVVAEFSESDFLITQTSSTNDFQPDWERKAARVDLPVRCGATKTVAWLLVSRSDEP